MKSFLLVVLFAFGSASCLAANPCKEDKTRYCKGKKAKSGELRACFKKNKSNLSKACRQHKKKKGKL